VYKRHTAWLTHVLRTYTLVTTRVCYACAKRVVQSKKICAQKNLEWESILTIHERILQNGFLIQKIRCTKIYREVLIEVRW
jgi:predicted amidophosphoribosyltransferase